VPTRFRLVPPGYGSAGVGLLGTVGQSRVLGISYSRDAGASSGLTGMLLSVPLSWMAYSYDRRPHTALLGDLSGLVRKYMGMLKIDAAPTVKVRNTLGARMRGTTAWVPGHATSTIYVQKNVMGDPATLERIIAHEMAHHAVNMDNLREMHEILQEHGKANAGPYVKEYIDKLRQDTGPDSGHGEPWQHYVKIINQHMGSGFVTQTADDTYVEDAESKPYYLLIAKIPNGKYGYQIGVNLSPKMKRVIDTAVQRYEGKLVKTTDPKWQHGPRIGSSNWATSSDKQQEMQRLHQSS